MFTLEVEYMPIVILPWWMIQSTRIRILEQSLYHTIRECFVSLQNYLYFLRMIPIFSMWVLCHIGSPQYDD